MSTFFETNKVVVKLEVKYVIQPIKDSYSSRKILCVDIQC